MLSLNIKMSLMQKLNSFSPLRPPPHPPQYLKKLDLKRKKKQLEIV